MEMVQASLAAFLANLRRSDCVVSAAVSHTTRYRSRVNTTANIFVCLLTFVLHNFSKFLQRYALYVVLSGEAQQPLSLRLRCLYLTHCL